ARAGGLLAARRAGVGIDDAVEAAGAAPRDAVARVALPIGAARLVGPAVRRIRAAARGAPAALAAVAHVRRAVVVTRVDGTAGEDSRNQTDEAQERKSLH